MHYCLKSQLVDIISDKSNANHYFNQYLIIDFSQLKRFVFLKQITTSDEKWIVANYEECKRSGWMHNGFLLMMLFIRKY